MSIPTSINPWVAERKGQFRFAAQLNAGDHPEPGRTLVEAAKGIEELGFDAVALPDHLVDWTNPPAPWYDAWTAEKQEVATLELAVDGQLRKTTNPCVGQFCGVAFPPGTDTAGGHRLGLRRFRWRAQRLRLLAGLPRSVTRLRGRLVHAGHRADRGCGSLDRPAPVPVVNPQRKEKRVSSHELTR